MGAGGHLDGAAAGGFLAGRAFPGAGAGGYLDAAVAGGFLAGRLARDRMKQRGRR